LTLIVANGLVAEGVASVDPMDALCADDPSADECKVFD
jgi:glyceraldehyde-3-phosphate dehydrogenase (NADP+) (phosphorylating)